ncbi:MAG TPA: CvpA family protein [Chloroflexota bacterium]|nr:CvpA family protein [Chloroflexota bacterium]
MPNLVDGLLVAIVLAAMLWGWHTGVLRQLVAVSATMVAFMVAEQLYEPLGGAFNDAALVRTAAFFQAMSYLLVMFFIAAAWFVLIHRLYPYTRLGAESDATIRGLDGLGGMLLGLVLGALLVIATVGVSELLVYSRWPFLESSQRRAAIHYAIQDSLVVRTLFKEAPDFANYVGHWVPGMAIAEDGRIQP